MTRGDRDDDARPAARLAALGLSPSPRAGAPQASELDAAPFDPGRPDPQESAPRDVTPASFGVASAWLARVSATANGPALLALAGVCAVCIAVTAFVVLHRRGTPVADPAPLPVAVSALPAPTPSGVVVDVGGRVRHPGLVTLSPGARVADALAAAGGAIRRSDLVLVDLAARVTDGELLLVGVSGGGGGAAAPGGAAAGSGSPGPVDLNTATVDQLDTLPGIGPVLAQRIIDWRTANGGFHSVDDLNQVSGIGDSIFAEISPLVTV